MKRSGEVAVPCETSSLDRGVRAQRGPAVTPIKLLLAITDLDLGGSPLVARAVALGLRDTGEFAVTVVSLARPGVVGEMLEKEGITVLSCDAQGPRDIGAIGRFVHLARRLRPEILYSMLVHANMVAACAKPFLPGCVFYQSIHTLQPRPRWHWLAQGLVSPAADGVIAPARAVLDRLGKYGFYQQGIVVPNGIDYDLFANAAPWPAGDCPWPAGAMVLGYVGRFDAVKRLYLLIEALAQLAAMDGAHSPWHLALVGYGPEQNRLEKLAEALGIRKRVHFLGPTTMPHRWYKTFDFFVFPAISEGFGLVLAEALASGTPVVACDSAAAREILEFGRLGELVDCQQKNHLAHVMQRLIAQPGRLKMRSVAGQKAVEARYTVGAMVAEHSKIFKNFSRNFAMRKYTA